MSNDAEKRIRDRAYHLWEAAGRPHGRDEEFWHRATAEEGAASPATQDTHGSTTAQPAAAQAQPARSKPAAPAPAAKTEPAPRKAKSRSKSG